MNHPMPSERLRVLHLGSPTGLYGAERWILALAKNLPRTRVESWVGVVKDAPDLEAPLCSEAQRFDIRTHIFTAYGKLSLSAIGQIRRFVREKHIDVVHTHGYKTDILGTLAVRGLNCVTVATPHGFGASPGAKVLMYEALDRLCFYFMDAVAPLSEELREGLDRLPGLGRRLSLILNGVDLSEVDSAGNPPEPLSTWRAEGALVIGYIGRLDSGKRIDTLIRAFHNLQVSQKRLCIIGEGPGRADLEHLVCRLGGQNHAHFLGFRADRLELLRGLDIFVLPSQREGVPRCVMEAMASGTAVLASDIPGCRTLVQHDVTGLLFTAGDEVDLERQLARLAADSALRQTLARAAQLRVREAWSAEAMARRYLALYENIASRELRRQAAKGPS